MRTRVIWPGYATIADAIRYLASACDGAIRRDGHGFNTEHTAFGHWLARQPDHTWGPWHRYHSAHLVRIYRRQLHNAGFDTNAILSNAPPRRVRPRRLRHLAPCWAPDPTGLWELRWWNGIRWTHHVTARRSTVD